MGEVYKARDTRLDRTVAIKILPAAIHDDADQRARFESEARAVAALNPPHICTLYDVGPDYLVMEMVDGLPLAGPLPLARALEFATQILSALDAAHRVGITHRDLKPGNILVTKQGIKLLDFGLAKLDKTGPVTSTARSVAHAPSESPTMAQTLTGVHMILGTGQYMSPEQGQGKHVAGPKVRPIAEGVGDERDSQTVSEWRLGGGHRLPTAGRLAGSKALSRAGSIKNRSPTMG